MQQVLQLMVLHLRSLLVQVVQVVRRKALAELMQVTVNLLLFRVVELQRGLQLAAAAAVMATAQVLLAVQVAVEEMEGQEERLLQVKETPEPLVYPIAQVIGLVVVVAVLVERPQHLALRMLVQVELVLKFPGFQQQSDQRSV
jgi:hypothetical protein